MGALQCMLSHAVCRAGKDRKLPKVLVLTPTRELAQQILGVAAEASEHVGHRQGACPIRPACRGQ